MTVYLLKNRSEDTDKERSDPYEEIIEDCQFVPILDYVPVALDELAEEFKGFHNCLEYHAIIITSQRAVDVLKLIVNRCGAPECLLDLPCYTVGPITSERLKLVGFRNVYGGETGNGEALAAHMLNIFGEVNTKRKLLFLAGEVHRKLLPQSLEEAGHTVHTRVVYTTVPCNYMQELKQSIKASDWIVFFSPSNTQDLIAHIKECPTDTQIAAIGPTTRKYLEDHEVKVDAMAEIPSAQGLAQALQICQTMLEEVPQDSDIKT